MREINDFLLSPHFPPLYNLPPTRCSSLLLLSVPVREKKGVGAAFSQVQRVRQAYLVSEEEKLKGKSQRGRIHCPLTDQRGDVSTLIILPYAGTGAEGWHHREAKE